MQVGTMLRCLHPEGQCLTRGRVYTVLAHQDDWVVVRDDFGHDGRFPLVRFRVEREGVPEVAAAGVDAGARSLPGLSILRAGARL